MERKRTQKESQNFHKKFPKRMKIKLVGVFTAIVLAFVFGRKGSCLKSCQRGGVPEAGYEPDAKRESDHPL